MIARARRAPDSDRAPCKWLGTCAPSWSLRPPHGRCRKTRSRAAYTTPVRISSAAITAAHTDRIPMAVVTTARETANRRNTLWTCASRQSTAMFAWLDDPTAHGTLIEIGYAKALNIPIVINTPPARQAVVVRSSLGMPQRHRSEMWFALTSADVHIEAATPQLALAEAISALDDWAPA